jgi:hypothetical protein
VTLCLCVSPFLPVSPFFPVLQHVVLAADASSDLTLRSLCLRCCRCRSFFSCCFVWCMVFGVVSADIRPHHEHVVEQDVRRARRGRGPGVRPLCKSQKVRRRVLPGRH